MEAGRASETAYTVLQGMLKVAQDPLTSHLVPTEKARNCRTILEGSATGQKKLRQLASPLWMRWLLLQEAFFLPGISTHYVTRKKVIEEMVQGAIDDGATQVINLGAGFDTLMYELSQKRPDLHFAEIDHPATFAAKQQALGALEGDNLHLLPVDLSRVDVQEAIEQIPGFDGSKQTCFICEGVLMYLARPDIERLFAALSALCGPGTRFIFTAVPAMDSPSTNATWLLRNYLKYLGEPLAWHMETGETQAFVEAQGYQLDAVVDGPGMKAKYLSALPDHPFHLGEFVVQASIPKPVSM